MRHFGPITACTEVANQVTGHYTAAIMRHAHFEPPATERDQTSTEATNYSQNAKDGSQEELSRLGVITGTDCNAARRQRSQCEECCVQICMNRSRGHPASTSVFQEECYNPFQTIAFMKHLRFTMGGVMPMTNPLSIWRFVSSSTFGLILMSSSIMGSAQERLPVCAYRLDTLRKQLNAAAVTGYRLAIARQANALPCWADFLLSRDATGAGGLCLLMEKAPDNEHYEYRILPKGIRASEWERDINEAAAEGFRILPDKGVVLRQGVVIGTLESQLILMEKPPGTAQKREYVVVSQRGVGAFRTDLEKHFAAGELLLWMAPLGELQLAILEKTSNVPCQRVFASSKTSDLIAQINEAARQGFRLMLQVGDMGVFIPNTVAYMVSDGTAREYRYLNNKRKSMDEFKLTAQSGFHLLPEMTSGSLLTLEKVSGSNTSFAYRISEDQDEIRKMLPEGWTVLQVPMPFLGEKRGVVLENTFR